MAAIINNQNQPGTTVLLSTLAPGQMFYVGTTLYELGTPDSRFANQFALSANWAYCQEQDNGLITPFPTSQLVVPVDAVIKVC